MNWLGEVKCSVVIPDMSPHLSQLPVISVVRETETQLLPDVGAIVTCKVRSERFQGINKVVVFGFVSGSYWVSLLDQVTSINPRYAKVHILYVGSTPLKDRFRGTIRYERDIPSFVFYSTQLL